MAANGRRLCSVMGGGKILLFSLLLQDCWCCIFHYLFSISTHARLTSFFCSSLVFSKKPLKVLVFCSCPSYVILKWGYRKAWSDQPVFKCTKGDSDLPLSLLICLLPLWLFSPNVIIQVSPPSPLQLRLFCVLLAEKKHARYGTGYILLNSESIRVQRQILACAKPW